MIDYDEKFRGIIQPVSVISIDYIHGAGGHCHNLFDFTK